MAKGREGGMQIKKTYIGSECDAKIGGNSKICEEGIGCECTSPVEIAG